MIDIRQLSCKPNRLGFLEKQKDEMSYSIPILFTKDDIICLQNNGKYGCINRNGKIIIPFKYDNITLWPNGLIITSSNDKHILCSINDECVTELCDNKDIKYLDCYGYYARIPLDCNYYFFDTYGNKYPDTDKIRHQLNIERDLLYVDNIQYRNNLLESDKYFSRDYKSNKKTAIEGKFDAISNYEYGLAITLYNGKYGLIDDQYNVLLDPTCDEIQIISNKNLIIKRDNKSILSNVYGEEVLELNDSVLILGNLGKNLVIKRNEYIGIIDFKGNNIIESRYDKILFDNYNDIYVAIINDKVDFYTNKGNSIYSINTTEFSIVGNELFYMNNNDLYMYDFNTNNLIRIYSHLDDYYYNETITRHTSNEKIKDILVKYPYKTEDNRLVENMKYGIELSITFNDEKRLITVYKDNPKEITDILDNILLGMVNIDKNIDYPVDIKKLSRNKN